MRKNIQTLAVLMALSAIGPAAFSQESPKELRKNEISVGVGGPSFWAILDGIECGPRSSDGVIEPLYGKKYGDKHYTPSYSVSYNYYTKKWLSFNTRLSYSGSYRYVYTGTDSHVDYLEVTPCVTLMEMVRFHYMNKEKVRLYSSIGAGVSLAVDSLLPSLQFTFFGVSFGKKVFGFVEMGMGTEYISYLGGIGYRF